MSGGGLTAKYTVLQSSYWLTTGAIFSYATVFLLSRDFSAAQIGLLTAWANVLTALLQPAVSALAQRSRRLTLCRLVLLIAVGALLPTAALLLAPRLMPLTAGLYLLAMIGANVMLPLINAIGMDGVNRGLPLRFGLARGLASLFYAFFSYGLGLCVSRFGTAAGPGAACVTLCLLMGAALWFRSARAGTRASDPEQKERVPAPERLPALRRFLAFAGRYRRFLGVLAGVALLFAFHNVINTYLIQILTSFGGSSADMGLSLSIAALCEVPAMAFFEPLARRFSVRKLLRVSAAFFLVKALAFFLSGSVAAIHLGQALQMLSFALIIPASVYYANESMAAPDRLMGQGLMTAAITAGGVVGNIAGGFVVERLGVRPMLACGALLAAAGAALVFCCTARRGKREKTSPRSLSL